MRHLSPMICKISFMDGKTKAVGVMPSDTSQDVLESVRKKIGLQSVEGWALYEVGRGYIISMLISVVLCTYSKGPVFIDFFHNFAGSWGRDFVGIWFVA